MENWDDIWEKIGNKFDDLDSLGGLNGHQDRAEIMGKNNIKYVPKDQNKAAIDTVNDIIETTNLENKILEFGCGAGRLAKIFIEKKINYFGLEKSSSLVEKYKQKINKNTILRITDTKLPFDDNHFDTVFVWSVLHYLKDKKELNNLLSEFARISKKYIYLGDLVTIDNTKKLGKSYENLSHLIISREYIKNFFPNNQIVFNKNNVCFESRYNCIIKL